MTSKMDNRTRKRRRVERISPEALAIQHIASGEDQDSFSIEEVACKGKGVIARSEFRKGDFLLEYRGNRSYESPKGDQTYIYEFSHQDKKIWIDGTNENSTCRFVNDNHVQPNCTMKKMVHRGVPYLCLFARQDISSGEELQYNYGKGGPDIYEWRSGVTQAKVLSMAEELWELVKPREKPVEVETLSEIDIPLEDDDAPLEQEQEMTKKTWTPWKNKPRRMCPICQKWRSGHLKRHFKSHKHDARIKDALQHEQNGAQDNADLIYDQLRVKGIEMANAEEKKNPEPHFHRERRQSKTDMVQCNVCLKILSMTYFARHKQICSPLAGISMDVEHTIPQQIPEDFRVHIINKMYRDDVGQAALKDELITFYGHRRWTRKASKSNTKEKELADGIRSDMRQIANLYKRFLEFEEHESTHKNTADMFVRRNSHVLERAIHAVCDNEDGEMLPGKKRNLYHLLIRFSKKLTQYFLRQSDDVAADEVSKWRELFNSEKDEIFGQAELSIKLKKQVDDRRPSELPYTEDIKKLRKHIEVSVQGLIGEQQLLLWDTHTYITLRDLLCSWLVLVNGRRGGEPARLLKSELADALSDVWIGRHIRRNPEVLEMLQYVKLTFQMGKVEGSLVPLLIPLEAVAALKILSDDEVREQAGVTKKNPYVFATTNTSQQTHTNGTNALQGVLKDSPLDTSVLKITANKIRHLYATLFEEKQLPDHVRRNFYLHIGHSEKTDRNHYQCPPVVGEMQVARRLLEIQGRVVEQLPNSPDSSSVVSRITVTQSNTTAHEVHKNPKNKGGARTRRAGVLTTSCSQGNPIDKTVSQPRTSSLQDSKETHASKPGGARTRRAGVLTSLSSQDNPMDITISQPRTSALQDSKETHASKSVRKYTMWDDKNAKMVCDHFKAYIHKETQLPLPRKEEVLAFKSKTGLTYSPQEIKSKIYNEKKKLERRIQHNENRLTHSN